MYKFENVLINGANGGLGSQFAEELLKCGASKVFVTYRSDTGAGVQSGKLADLIQNYPDRIHPIKADSTKEEGMVEIARVVGEEVSEIHFLVNCVGYLHNSDHGPEKSLRKINEEQFLEAVRVNAFPTVLLAKYFMKLMRHKKEAVFAAISARVGSIEDNRAGGWYSYRGSKAMLNMMTVKYLHNHHHLLDGQQGKVRLNSEVKVTQQLQALLLTTNRSVCMNTSGSGR